VLRRTAAGWILLGALVVGPSRPAFAASDLQLKHAADGTLVVVGSGWHRDQQLVISLGKSRFDVRADGSGDFELDTGLASYQGDLTVHHADTSGLALLPLTGRVPNPLAVLFAQSVAEGVLLVTFLAGIGLVGAGIGRRWCPPRYPRR
jgi:hypothetical protein